MWYWLEQVYHLKRFSKYGILGDDVVIADEAIAKEYEHAVSELGVMISKQKSLYGAAEFAKKFRVRNLTKDFSPVPMSVLGLALLNSHHPYGAMNVHLRYNLKRFSTMCRLAGCGYRTLSRITSSSSLKLERLRALYSLHTLPLELFLGRGRPLDPTG